MAANLAFVDSCLGEQQIRRGRTRLVLSRLLAFAL